MTGKTKVKRHSREVPKFRAQAVSGFTVTKVEIGPADKPTARARMYFLVDNENMLENFTYRFSRPSEEYKSLIPEVRSMILTGHYSTTPRWNKLSENSKLRWAWYPVDENQERVITALKGDYPASKWFWSQTAGCSCGCSPGFIHPEIKGVDIYVTLHVENPPKKQPLTDVKLTDREASRLIGLARQI